LESLTTLSTETSLTSPFLHLCILLHSFLHNLNNFFWHRRIFLSFCLYVFLSFCLSVFLSYL
jgi:hypothetical protein